MTSFEITNVDELNIFKEDILKGLQRLFVQRGQSGCDTCLGVDAFQLKAIISLTK